MRSWLARWGIPILGSFCVYLLPLVGPHAVWFLGTALVAQLALGLTLAWSLRGSRLRLLVWLVGVPTLTAGLNLAYLVSIPSYFLIEPDTARERTDCQEHCFVPDIALLQVRTPVTPPNDGVGEWWVHERSGRYSLLRLPSCSVINADLPMPTVQTGGRVDFTLNLQYSVPGGAAMFDRYDMNVQRRSWWVLEDPMSPLVPAPEMTTIDGMPILASYVLLEVNTAGRGRALAEPGAARPRIRWK